MRFEYKRVSGCDRTCFSPSLIFRTNAHKFWSVHGNKNVASLAVVLNGHTCPHTLNNGVWKNMKTMAIQTQCSNRHLILVRMRCNTKSYCRAVTDFWVIVLWLIGSNESFLPVSSNLFFSQNKLFLRFQKLYRTSKTVQKWSIW